MRHYVNGLDRVLGASETASRFAYHILGEEAAAPAAAAPASTALVPTMTPTPPPAPSGSLMEHLQSMSADRVPDGVQTVAGAAAGYLVASKYYPEHPVLGTIGGASVGRNVPALLKPELRRHALCNMGQTGAAIAGSRMLEAHPVWGFILGHVVGGAVIHVAGLRK